MSVVCLIYAQIADIQLFVGQLLISPARLGLCASLTRIGKAKSNMPHGGASQDDSGDLATLQSIALGAKML